MIAKGTLLGPYEVDSLLGAGGMGEVYRARDTRLGRIVAIKVLIADLVGGDERRARFEREARAISALANPHICSLYDLGRAGDTEYLVMEYLEGETLADRIARGRLPLSQVLRYGAEIAEALEHAHRAGITHRDLKPGNIMLTESGVKLLDFGLAKLIAPKRVFSDESASSTHIAPLTAEGTIAGTIVYMSPEQLEAKPLDHRTDIFSLGIVLHEMATGQRPFSGNSPLSIAASILSSDPAPLRSLAPTSPPALERIILTALEKKPGDRWQTAHDVARQLRWLNEPSSSSTASGETIAPPAASRSRLRVFAAVAAALIAGTAITWSALHFANARAAAMPVTRLQLVLPPEIVYRSTGESSHLALSPDGRTLCVSAIQGNVRALYLRRLDSADVHKIEGTEDGGAPFWSSDGQWIGYSAHGKLWKIKAAGVAVPVALCDVSASGAIGTWHGQTILFADDADGRREIYRVSADGGPVTQATSLKPGEWRQTWPLLLPDERHFLYLNALSEGLDRQLLLASLDSPKTSVLLRNISFATLVAPDELLYVRDARLLAQHVDLAKGVMTGEPVLVAKDVEYFYPSSRAVFDSANGVIVYRTDTRTGRLTLSDRAGALRVIDDQGVFAPYSGSFSHDGRRAAVTLLNRSTGLGDLWIYDLARGTKDRFTNEPGLAITPIWAPDDHSLVYSAAAAGALPHLVRRTIAVDRAEDLVPQGTFQFAGSFTPDGSALYFERSFAKTRTDIFRVDLATKRVEPVLATKVDEADPQVSPDGKWLAYVSDVSGVPEVYLDRLGGGEAQRIRISTNGGESPRWRGDGSELFYRSLQNEIVTAQPRGAGGWSDASTQTLFRAPADTTRYAAAPDGQSFLFIEGKAGATDSVFQVVLGWH